MRLQVDEILRVAESPGVGSIVWPADLRDHCFHFRKRCENIALIGGEFFSFRETGTICERAARPDSSFVEMRQKLRSDDAAKAQINCSSQSGDADTKHHPAMLNGPTQPPAILLREP